LSCVILPQLTTPPLAQHDIGATESPFYVVGREDASGLPCSRESNGRSSPIWQPGTPPLHPMLPPQQLLLLLIRPVRPLISRSSADATELIAQLVDALRHRVNYNCSPRRAAASRAQSVGNGGTSVRPTSG